MSNENNFLIGAHASFVFKDISLTFLSHLCPNVKECFLERAEACGRLVHVLMAQCEWHCTMGESIVRLEG